MTTPSLVPPLAGVRTAADAPAEDGGAEIDGRLPVAAAAAPNCRGRGKRAGCDGRQAAVYTSGGAGVLVCLWLERGRAAVTAAARAAAAAELVGGGLFAEDARPREGSGSVGQRPMCWEDILWYKPMGASPYIYLQPIETVRFRCIGV